jgi:surface antigen
VISAAVVFLLNGTAAHAQNDPLQRLSDGAITFWEKSKALAETDSFNMRIAFRKAVKSEETGIPFRWNNIHTKHHGKIVLLSFTKPYEKCVNFKHTYYLGSASPIEEKGTVCRDDQSHWNDLAIRAAFNGTRSADPYPAATVDGQIVTINAIDIPPRQNREIALETQDLLSQLNYDPGPVDGQQGLRTRRAIEQYQRDAGLPVTGRVSIELTTALKQTLANMDKMPLAPIDNGSNAKSEFSSSSGDMKQSGLQASPDEGGTGEADDKKGASELASLTPLGDDEASLHRNSEAERPGTLSRDEGSAAPSATNTSVISADEQQTGFILDQVDIRYTNSAEASKKTSILNDIYSFPWFFAFLGLGLFGITGALFSSIVVRRKHGSFVSLDQRDQVTGAAEGRISRESGEDSAQTIVSMRDYVQAGSQQNEVAQTEHVTKEPIESAVEFQSSTRFLEEDSGDMVLQAITDFDDIIKETERVLSVTCIDRYSRSHIVEAAEVAKSMIEKTLNSDPIGGSDHSQTAKAIREATSLIKDALETNPGPDMSQLSAISTTQKLGPV